MEQNYRPDVLLITDMRLKYFEVPKPELIS